MSLSIDEGEIPIAIAEPSGQVIFYNKNRSTNIAQETEDIVNQAFKDLNYGKKHPRRIPKAEDYELVISHLIRGTPLENDYQEMIAERAKEIEEDRKGKDYMAGYGDKLTPIPYHDPGFDNSRTYLAGQSGSGKSFTVGRLVREWLKEYPKVGVFLFSEKREDPELDRIKRLKRFTLNKLLPEVKPKKRGRKKSQEESDEDEPEKEIDLGVDWFEPNDVIIFDDCDTIKDKATQKELDRIRANVLSVGRSKNYLILSTSHLMTDHNKTRILLNECNSFIYFPQGVNNLQKVRVLGEYFGFSKRQIEALNKLKSRWIEIIRVVPPVIVYEFGVMILDES